jgi:sortase B
MNKKKIWLAVFIISIIIFIAAAGTLAVKLLSGRLPGDESTAAAQESTSATSAEDTRPVSPVDFAALRETNADIYAWIKIPNTKVDYPILESYTEGDFYYLKHNLNKQYDDDGSIYTQIKNNTDFSDPNTLIYGHNRPDGSKFTTLLNFKDTDFFNENRYFYIYTPGRLLTYEIFAAYLYDDRHILNSFDFYNDEVFQNYLDSCLSPKSMVKNVREGITLTVKDRIVTLSTCPTWYRSEPFRYLVQGVLRKDEQTQ